MEEEGRQRGERRQSRERAARAGAGARSQLDAGRRHGTGTLAEGYVAPTTGGQEGEPAMTDLTWMDACAQAELVRSGQASPPELVAAAIERIERVNPRLNAVIHQRFDKAVREAAGPLPDGPFRGVPLLVKDLACQTEGDPFHCGARFLKELGWTADHDSAYITRFRHAGFVIVGRTNV